MSSGVSEIHLVFYRLKDLLLKGELEESALELVAGIGRCLFLALPCFSIGGQGVLFGERREGQWPHSVYTLSLSPGDLVQRRTGESTRFNAPEMAAACLRKSNLGRNSTTPRRLTYGMYTTLGTLQLNPSRGRTSLRSLYLGLDAQEPAKRKPNGAGFRGTLARSFGVRGEAWSYQSKRIHRPLVHFAAHPIDPRRER